MKRIIEPLFYMFTDRAENRDDIVQLDFGLGLFPFYDMAILILWCF